MKCENCGNENIEIINARKGHYLCGKCGRDTEALYEREHDAEIRAKAIDEFAEKMNARITEFILEHHKRLDFVSGVGMGWKFVEEIATELKGE